jgi:hypothetical protein
VTAEEDIREIIQEGQQINKSRENNKYLEMLFLQYHQLM